VVFSAVVKRKNDVACRRIDGHKIGDDSRVSDAQFLEQRTKGGPFDVVVAFLGVNNAMEGQDAELAT
jgi:hypothetical protein